MALSGLDIFKLLPRTNCGDCGVPTCMAFAMKLAQKKAELAECPHASDEAQEVLGAASEPPIKLVTIGGKEPLQIGAETVMFRHEKSFYNPQIVLRIISVRIRIVIHFLGVAQGGHCPLIMILRLYMPEKSRNSLNIMVEDFGPGIHNGLQRRLAAFEVRNKHFDGTTGL